MTWWLYARALHGKSLARFNLARDPCPSIQAQGLYAVRHAQYWLEDDGHMTAIESTTNKPDYRVPSMTDVNAAPRSGLTHVSTFSGGGGTCIGFRLAGFDTLWANDVDSHARECYGRNLGTKIDGRNIRSITATDILSDVGLREGELDVFEGSPPCTAFSTAGKRAKGWGKSKEHAGVVQANVEDLFFEWIRIAEGLQARAVVAENVFGMVKGVAKGYYNEVMRRLKAIGYHTEARLLDAQWLGVPQQRQRVIIVGIRKDIGAAPRFPKPLPYRYSVRDALPWLSSARFDPRGQFRPVEEFVDRPSPAIIGSSAEGGGRNSGHYLVSDSSSRRPDVSVQEGARPSKSRSGDGPSPPVMAGRTTSIRLGPHGTYRGTHRSTDEPSPAVAASGMGSYDYDVGTSSHRRKFTILEIKRICSFPDDYEMSGSYAKQWARLGNSVPPMMAYHIGVAVREALSVVRR